MIVAFWARLSEKSPIETFRIPFNLKRLRNREQMVKGWRSAKVNFGAATPFAGVRVLRKFLKVYDVDFSVRPFKFRPRSTQRL
jgi:hypothetical protein